MKRANKRRAVVACLAAVTVFAAGCAHDGSNGSKGGSANGEKLKVSLGLIGQVTDAGILLAQDKGYFEGQGLQVESTQFSSAAQMVAPLASGGLDIGGGSLSSGLINAQSGGSKVKIVADKGSWGEKASGAILIRNDLVGKINSFRDLSGRNVAITVRGTASQLLPYRGLKDAGVDMNSVKLVEMSHTDMILALKQGSVDAAVIFDPQLTTALQTKAGTLWKDGSEIWPGLQQAELFYGARISNEAGLRFMKGYLCGVREYNRILGSGDEQQISALYQLLSKSSKVPVEQLRAARPIRLADDGQVRVDDLQRQADYLLELKFIQKGFDVNSIVDTSIAKKAAANLNCGAKK
jgi:NitT/TauT family transport system substrate-binding protein